MNARSVALITSILLLSAAPGGAVASTTEGRPLAVITQSTGADDVVYVGEGNDLWENVYTGGQWQTPYNTGIGPVGSAPTVTNGPGGRWLFWEGTDHNLWYARSANGTSWAGVTRIGLGPLGSQPTATSWTNTAGQTEINIFWQGLDGHLWEGWNTPGSGIWHGPQGLNMGHLGSAPVADASAGSADEGQLSVYWEGQKPFAIWKATTTGGPAGTWSTPADVGMGPLGSAPSVGLLEPSGTQDLFWTGDGPRQDLWMAKIASSGTTGPTHVGYGPLDSPPTAAPVWPDEQDIFWIGPGSTLWELTDQNGHFSGPVGPGAMNPPPPAVTTTPVTVTVPPPPPAPPQRARPVRARLRVSWTWNGPRTRLRRISISAFPRNGWFDISCRGHGCSRRGQRFSGRHALRQFTRAVGGRRYRAGDRITIAVAARGLRAEHVELFIRDGRVPTARLL